MPGPKHGMKEYYRAGSEKVAVMDLDDKTAQSVLNGAECLDGKYFGVYDGKVYEFKRTIGHVLHGFRNDNVSENIMRALKGLLTKEK